ncbi:MAG: DUF2782 domain-containing protein [Methyloprofundus sp.]|nr:DUF2782 domain-containing protein [Methyloprofundus sp.]
MNSKNILNYSFLSVLLLSPVFVNAVEDATPDVPEMPLPIQGGEPMEADITISREGDKVIHEYKVNGKIYKIKVIPAIGPAYYFIDPDGDGEMEEVTESDLVNGMKVNQWTILSW